MKTIIALVALTLLGVGPTVAAEHRIRVCHEGLEIVVDEHAVDAHLRHGDFVGSCDDRDRDGIADWIVVGRVADGCCTFSSPR